MRCGLYIRVSTEMQTERGESLDVQLKRLKAYAEAKAGWTVIDIYKDAGISAKDTKRSAFERMMRDLEARRIDCILCTKLDRLFRNTMDLLKTSQRFEELGVKFVCLDGDIDTTTPMGRVFSTIRGALAQFERETTADRVRDVMRSRAEEGKWNGGVVPYGYRGKDKILELNPVEVEMVKRIFRLYLERPSLKYVARKLNGMGIKTRKLGFWTTTTIRRMLTNPFYIGEVVYSKRSTSYAGKLKATAKESWIHASGNHPAIIDRQTLETTQKLICQHSKPGPNFEDSIYVLTNRIWCAVCGSRMHGHTTGRRGSKFPYYRCRGNTQLGPAKCPGNNIRADQLEQMIQRELRQLSINRHRVLEVLRTNQPTTADGAQNAQERLKTIRQERERLQRKSHRLLELYEDGRIEKGEFTERRKELQHQDAQLEKEEAIAQTQVGVGMLDPQSIEKSLGFLKNIADVYEELQDPVDRRLLMQNVLGRIIVGKSHIDCALEIPAQLFSSARDPKSVWQLERTGTHGTQLTNRVQDSDSAPIQLQFKVSRWSATTFGERVRKARLERALKQIDLARMLGVNELTVVNWEKDYTTPRPDLLKKLQKSLVLD